MSNTAPTTIVNTVNSVLSAIAQAAPIVGAVVSALAPEAAPVAALGVKIAQGVAAGVPEAIALWEQFQNGTVPAQSELDAYAAQELVAYNTLMADITAKLST